MERKETAQQHPLVQRLLEEALTQYFETRDTGSLKEVVKWCKGKVNCTTLFGKSDEEMEKKIEEISKQIIKKILDKMKHVGELLSYGNVYASRRVENDHTIEGTESTSGRIGDDGSNRDDGSGRIGDDEGDYSSDRIKDDEDDGRTKRTSKDTIADLLKDISESEFFEQRFLAETMYESFVKVSKGIHSVPEENEFEDLLSNIKIPGGNYPMFHWSDDRSIKREFLYCSPDTCPDCHPRKNSRKFFRDPTNPKLPSKKPKKVLQSLKSGGGSDLAVHSEKSRNSNQSSDANNG